ncbi:MAG TPA: hypothetical protein VK826_10565 [Bacteroidia bacterium]|nr:hypothetical protein [Bacteroidia bacterium]
MKIIKWIVVLAALVGFNLLVLECLLRVNGVFETSIESRLDDELKSADVIYDFSPNMYQRLKALGLENKFDTASYKKERRISYAEVEDYNPYPPHLRLYDSAYVVYNKNYEQKQLTVLSGESDATPSLLVSKARGDWTGYGDHFVTYVFYHGELNGSGPDYDQIDWYSWKGGSYDGFEEMLIVPMMIFELIILIVIIQVRKRKRARVLAKTKEPSPHS